jgi:hypothetical protein
MSNNQTITLEEALVLRQSLERKVYGAAIISIEQYAQRFPGKVEFREHSFIEGQFLGMHVVRDCALIGPHAVFVTGEGDILLEQNAGGEIIPNLQAAQTSPEALCPASLPEVLSLCSAWSHGFYHWMLDCLPKVHLAEKMGYSGFYLIPYKNGFARDSLALLGIDSSRVVEMTAAGVRVKELFIPTLREGHGMSNFPDFFYSYRLALLNGAGINSCDSSGGQRYYLARRDPNRPRRVVNETELLEHIQHYAFKRIFAEDLTLKDQIRLFSQGNVLLGPHGAGMLHAIFMPPRSVVIECFSPLYIMPVLAPLMRLMQHRYYLNFSYSSSEMPYQYHEDVLVGMELMKASLSAELMTQKPVLNCKTD